MTSDATHIQSARAETDAGPERLRNLVIGARLVLWGFDGPVCRLFAGHAAERVSADLLRWLEGRGLRGLPAEAGRVAPDPRAEPEAPDPRAEAGRVAPDPRAEPGREAPDPRAEPGREAPDPQAVLRAAHRRRPGGDLIAQLEERLTQEELRAAASAMPAAYADPLIRTWTAVGARQAVVTDRSPRAVRAYLAGRGLLACFEPRIYGRTPDAHRLAPDPHRLDRALHATGAVPSTTLVIGDTPAAVAAAREAGVGFLGYARAERKAEALRRAGAPVVIRSLEPVLRLLRE
ncbi:HAD family hydrolase [Streptomyces sp. NPDC052020]|uniref:HAD family hydrolase n=1 Tax=Streptomyces sp. NPDC052020 TaxID=3155677 RepID=UPI00341AAD2C